MSIEDVLLDRARDLYEQYERLMQEAGAEGVDPAEWAKRRNEVWRELGRVLDADVEVQGALL